MKNIADEGLPTETVELIELLDSIYVDSFPDMTKSRDELLVLQGKIELIRWLKEQTNGII